MLLCGALALSYTTDLHTHSTRKKDDQLRWTMGRSHQAFGPPAVVAQRCTGFFFVCVKADHSPRSQSERWRHFSATDSTTSIAKIEKATNFDDNASKKLKIIDHKLAARL